jgi:hypothetical protein
MLLAVVFEVLSAVTAFAALGDVDSDRDGLALGLSSRRRRRHGGRVHAREVVGSNGHDEVGRDAPLRWTIAKGVAITLAKH